MKAWVLTRWHGVGVLLVYDLGIVIRLCGEGGDTQGQAVSLLCVQTDRHRHTRGGGGGGTDRACPPVQCRQQKPLCMSVHSYWLM